jgi:SAM-dependent methyltransferase
LTTSPPSKTKPDPLFDDPEAYDEMLGRGIGLTGEDKGFFIEGRIAALRRMLPADFAPARILDYGCGVGDGVMALARAFPQSEVVGADVSRAAISTALRRHAGRRVGFVHAKSSIPAPPYQLCVCSGVFHHIPPEQRQETLVMLAGALTTDGFLVIFENNPYNPGTRWVMARIPFDRDAVPLRPRETRERLSRAGYRIEGGARFLFFFPRFLAFLRPLEAALARFPLGGQYGFAARPPGVR